MNLSVESGYKLKQLLEPQDADKVTAFFFSANSFDDLNFTPGELEHFKHNPQKALQGHYRIDFVENGEGEIVGVNCYTENEQQTGGYYWDYMVVHKDYRNHGIASMLTDAMFAELREREARYVITYTCSTDLYLPIRRVFARLGFQEIGECPDYYYEGEGRLIYYRKL